MDENPYKAPQEQDKERDAARRRAVRMVAGTLLLFGLVSAVTWAAMWWVLREMLAE